MRLSLVVALASMALGCGESAAASDASVDAHAPDGAVARDAGAEDDARSPRQDAGSDAGPTRHLSAGCSSGDGLAEGETTFELEGLTRRFIVRLPTGYTRDRPWPLVLALHGNGGSATEWDRTTGAQNMRAELASDAILIVAEAIDGDWRDYDMPASAWPARIETELAYFDEILVSAKRELCLDEDAIFAMGFSGGGSFSGVLACRRTDIRAIAVGGAVIYFEPDACVGPPPAAWITLGITDVDGRTPYRDFWRDRAGCDATSMATAPDPCTAYDGCDPETPVHYCEHPGGHTWPSFGSAATWAFFQRFVTE